MQTAHSEETYRHPGNAVRLTRKETAEAIGLQRKGMTLRDIAQFLDLPLSAVHQSLYWDVVQK